MTQGKAAETNLLDPASREKPSSLLSVERLQSCNNIHVELYDCTVCGCDVLACIMKL